jgi:hypothetical protein
MMSQGNNIPPHPLLFSEIGRTNAGIVLLSSDRKVLYVNNAAHDLLLRWRQKEGRAPSRPLPRAVDDLLDQTLTLLHIPVQHRGWRRLTEKRLVEASGHSVCVQALGISHGLDTHRSLILLTMK